MLVSPNLVSEADPRVKRFPWASAVNLSLFIGLHVACFAAIFTGVSAVDLALCAALYVVRMFGITAGYHRYFSHKTYKLNRFWQFMMALLAMSSSQKGVLWWASHHRRHHQHSDTEHDIHSPVRRGFWWSHLGWIISDKYRETDTKVIKDFMRYPELIWLDQHVLFPVVALGAFAFFGFGASGLVVGFVWSTVLLFHATFCINSLAHIWGTRRFNTPDGSRNNWALAVATLGEGWHNNHHHYMASARQGFLWWEIDVTYYVLRALARVGIVSELREPPAKILAAIPADETPRESVVPRPEPKSEVAEVA